MKIPDLPAPRPGVPAPKSSCACPLPPGQLSMFGWHMEKLGPRGCYVYNKTSVDDKTGERYCFRGSCDGKEVRCAYEGTDIAIERCPSYMAAVVHSAEMRQRHEAKGGEEAID